MTANTPQKQQETDELNEKLKKTFGSDLSERMTARLPGLGPKNLPYGYTSESEIRENVMAAVRAPPRKLSEKQMAAVGLDVDPVLKLKWTQQQKRQLSDDERIALAERWIDRQLASARKRHRIMTDQQLADWRIGRRLSQGDRARYIGPDKNEVTQASLVVPRPHGQLGIITQVIETRDARILTFHPLDAVMPIEAPGADKMFVDLQVREHTPGWLQIERLNE